MTDKDTPDPDELRDTADSLRGHMYGKCDLEGAADQLEAVAERIEWLEGRIDRLAGRVLEYLVAEADEKVSAMSYDEMVDELNRMEGDTDEK